MHGNISAAAAGAINDAAAFGNEDEATAANGSGSSLWLRDAAKTMLGKDAGLHLHYITGYPERSCYYYAKGERQPPEDFLRKLFHSEQGEPFLRAFMHDCAWWQEREQRRRSVLKQLAELA